MHLRSRRVLVLIASVLLVRLPHITTPQELSSSRTQGNCQGKNLPIPKALQTKKRKEAAGEQIEVTTNSDPPTVAKSPIQLTNISMGTTIS
jgi:hypothetical protein